MRPIIEAAINQPGVEPMLRRIAADGGDTLERTRQKWVDAQEADLLLESGGDPESVSSAGACGVAQWMPATGLGQGLKVDIRLSAPLTVKIAELDRQIAWLDYLAAPGADPTLPGAPVVTASEIVSQRGALTAQREALCTQRRAVDARFDPRQAIFAQTRYLLKLYARIPGIDWLFQAYHGGEAGVAKLLRFYSGSGSAARLIRHGFHGRRLTYEQVYLTTSPTQHSAAFAYLYGRGDDHRHYWWKLRASEVALADCRRDRAAFEREAAALLPGRGVEALWYPDGQALAFQNWASVVLGRERGLLRPVMPTPMLAIVPQSLDAAHTADYAALRSVATGALQLVASLYGKAGGHEPLAAGDLMLTPALVEAQRLLARERPRRGPVWPPSRPGPPDLNYHTTGLVFDLLRPQNTAQSRVFAYVLGALEDRRILSVVEVKEAGQVRYHLCPNPQYGRDLERRGI